MIALVIIDILFMTYIVFVLINYRRKIKSSSKVLLKITDRIESLNNRKHQYIVSIKGSEKSYVFTDALKRSEFKLNNEIEVYKIPYKSGFRYSSKIMINKDLVALCLIEMLFICTTIFVYFVSG